MYFKKILNASKASEHPSDRGIVEIPVGYYLYVPGNDPRFPKISTTSISLPLIIRNTCELQYSTVQYIDISEIL